MDAAVYVKMLHDVDFLNLRKMQYKYSKQQVSEMVMLLRQTEFKALPIQDFSGTPIVWLDPTTRIHMSAYHSLYAQVGKGQAYSLEAMEDEIHSTLDIENIQSSRQSIRRILNGQAPANDEENRIYGMKKGLEYIADPSHPITEENIHTLYMLAVGNFLSENDRLKPGQKYRYDDVFVVGDKIEHQGLPFHKVPLYMKKLVDFIHEASTMNDFLKAAAIHFDLAYLHPYFDGNGRMARMLHLWYLVQKGYPAALFIPLSSYVNQSRNKYYRAYTITEENQKISGVLDITPFLVYFIENVYNHIKPKSAPLKTIECYQEALSKGFITEKEKDLFNFILSAYTDREFSTKQLEKDFNSAAYATIYHFVHKFMKIGLLDSQKYGNRIKYRLKK